MTFGRIVRRSFLYLGLALAGLAVVTLVVLTGKRYHISVPFQWIYLAVFTGALTYGIFKTSWEYCRRVSFWLLYLVSISVHLGAFIYLINLYPEFKPIWYIPIVLMELTVFRFLSQIILNRPPKLSARR
jgi:hypothetical protein